MEPAGYATGATTLVDVLRADQELIGRLFQQYLDAIKDSSLERQELAQTICDAVTRHRKAEQEILYPEIRKASATLADAIEFTDLEISRWIAYVRANPADDRRLGLSLARLFDLSQRRMQTRESIVFPFILWRLPGASMPRLAGECARRLKPAWCGAGTRESTSRPRAESFSSAASYLHAKRSQPQWQ